MRHTRWWGPTTVLWATLMLKSVGHYALASRRAGALIDGHIGYGKEARRRVAQRQRGGLIQSKRTGKLELNTSVLRVHIG